MGSAGIRREKEEERARRCKVEVKIYKDQYLLAADAGPEYVQQLADEVDQRMRRTAEANPHLGPLRIVMLTLLGMAADVNAIERQIEDQESTLAARCLEIERDIERLLGVA
jgi:cell division protein ZapA (FtsZ GTPase activity inhibitor)